MNAWQSAYSTVAEVAATLCGLLFVSLSVKLSAASSEQRHWILLVAKRSFFDFLSVLVIALVFLVPGVSSYLVGWAILWISVTRIIWHVSHWRTYRSSATSTPRLIREYVTPMAATLLLVIAGVDTLLSYAHAPKLIYTVALTLLVGACQNAWRLLIR